MSENELLQKLKVSYKGGGGGGGGFTKEQRVAIQALAQVPFVWIDWVSAGGVGPYPQLKKGGGGSFPPASTAIPRIVWAVGVLGLVH